MKCLALDGNSLAYRAFFALPADMATSTGQVTNAVVGFTSMLVNLLRDQKPDSVIVVFDRPEPTFRHRMVPEYKAQRESAPDVLRQQMGIIRELLDALGVTVLDMAGFEGDDIIATVAKKCDEAGHDIVIVTGDRDSYQLVRDPHVKVLYNKRGVSDYALYDEAGIHEKTGVVPSRYVDYAALRGDPSDNLVGANGVGEKTAAKLVNQHATLEEILDSAEHQTPKIRGSLEEGRERVLRNASIMVLRDDLEIAVDPAKCLPKPNWVATRRLLEFLEMKTMTKRLSDAFAPWISGVIESDGIKDAADQAELSGEHSVYAIDGPTPDKIINGSKMVATVASHGGAVVVAVDDIVHVFEVAQFSALADLLGEAKAQSIPVVGHDIKPLLRHLEDAGLGAPNVHFDTAIAAYLLDPVDGSHALTRLVDLYLGSALPEGEATSAGELDFGDVTRSYSLDAASARAVAALVGPMTSALEAAGMLGLFTDVEVPLIGVLARMESRGIGVDRSGLVAIRDALAKRVNELTVLLHDLVGHEFNLNSPTQLQKILFEERNLTKG
ncbi:MAG: polymerase, partial [Actinomycetota bacterium]